VRVYRAGLGRQPPDELSKAFIAADGDFAPRSQVTRPSHRQSNHICGFSRVHTCPALLGCIPFEDAAALRGDRRAARAFYVHQLRLPEQPRVSFEDRAGLMDG
jgi:hypothetical protein